MNKKIKSKIKMACIAVVALACVMPVRVFAVDTNGFEVSISSVKLQPGEEKKFAITPTNGVGRLNISSSNEQVAAVSESAVFLDGGSEEVTITAGKIGRAMITILATDNFADFETESILEGQSATINVTVAEEIPDGPGGQDSPDGPDSPVGPIDPVDPVDPKESGDEGGDGDEELPVPSTAGTTPNTGSNTDDNNGGVELLYVFPVILIGVIIVYNRYFGKNKRRKFEL